MSSLPRHIAIIMDGNGRWAEQHGLPRTEGHKAGTRSARKIVTQCRKLGIAHVTFYTFSKENWSRPREEVAFLFEMLQSYLKSEMDSLLEQDIRLHVLGDWGDLPFALRQILRHVCAKSSHCKSMVVNLALNYSGREEIVRACRKMLSQGVSSDQVTEQFLADNLDTAGQPDPDLIIRTSGEQRLSNFLLYQAAYSELIFTPVKWPDFDEGCLQAALDEYSRRSRRFGGLEQPPA
ncbi:polyprenyl diphosphate synthase [Desulfonatronum thioautotrophicum]|uniref:polyprenyl diphosphate synthase n=1 Tax=Desulfonatronum thioautotrophicum TaxID=617001 RepID=UPI000ACA5694|nr:polyprenyl diphosphate synthase [Desulfonatronum thioautotrophicum]